MVAKKKKVVKKKSNKKKKATKSSSSSHASEEKLIKSLIKRDEILVDNFVGLQKALVNVSIKFNELTERVDKLLTIYQKAADIFVEKQIKESNRRVELDRKVNNVMQQNKALARRQVRMQKAPVAPSPPTPPISPKQRISVSQGPKPPGTPSITSNTSTPSEGVIPPAPPAPEPTKPRPLPTQ